MCERKAVERRKEKRRKFHPDFLFPFSLLSFLLTMKNHRLRPAWRTRRALESLRQNDNPDAILPCKRNWMRVTARYTIWRFC